ncbi:putative yippee-like protein Os10g0369500 isoform X1 [Punica granatum]|uniref:Yippee-like protein Os10g0369500 isoform X1 n=1 Tax=Punica granatum TaxID=22663 RepID=A0A6P8DSR7_PUNGR|nr:putative yippee-like protein Os10g0369500 isoform X1 [Punica granatum]XP_031398940.1 putative yippee-like protein Os10g0369500 isoform X1 [Punica granatum]
MGRLYIQNLIGEKIFKCKYCRVDSASHDDIISKDFRGRFGRAYLFKNAVNISLGPSENRNLTTGLHIVNDIYCSSCQQILGWRYEKRDCLHWKIGILPLLHEKAYEESEKYKEGLYILEKERMLKDGW